MFDVIFAVWNLYKKEQDGENASGIYCEMPEDESHIEYYVNFLNSRGRQPVITEAQVTVNDPMSDPCMARHCVLQIGRVKTFRV